MKISVRKGLDIKLKGESDKIIADSKEAKVVAQNQLIFQV